MNILKIAVVTALFFGALASYGVYSWLREARATEPGVTCYTGKFPALVPVVR